MPKPLLRRCREHSLREFWEAALERHQDAQALADAGRLTAAIYLWGYAAEMTLKSAYFRLVGYQESQAVTLADIRNAAKSSANFGTPWPAGSNLHDIDAWAILLINTRVSRSILYQDQRFNDQLRSRTRRLKEDWGETLRYHKNQAYGFEVARVRDAVEWLMGHYPAL